MKPRKTVIDDAAEQPEAVLLDWNTFRQFEEAVEDNALAARLDGVGDKKPLSRTTAMRRYCARKAN